MILYLLYLVVWSDLNYIFHKFKMNLENQTPDPMNNEQSGKKVLKFLEERPKSSSQADESWTC